MADTLLTAMAAIGLDPPEDISPGKWTRFPGIGKRNGNRAGYAFLFPDGLGGIYGDFSCGLRETWKADKVSSFTPAEKIDFERMVKESRAKAEREQEEEYQKAARIASKLCLEANTAKGSHSYLKTKHVKPCGLLAYKKDLLMPLYSCEGEITSYQTIAPDGKKLLMAGGRKKGSAFPIGPKDLPDGARTFVVEGFATGASVHAATGEAVIVAVDAGNLRPVIEELIKKGRDRIIIAADNDYGKKINTGVNTARGICEQYPQVKWMAPPEIPGLKAVDWNDYHVKYGLEAITSLLSVNRPKSISAEEIMKQTYKELQWAVPGIIPEGLTILAGRPKFGKSWLMLGLAYAVATGGKAWGFADTKKAGVHYLALEDSERRIQDRIHNMEGYFNSYPDNLHIYTDFPRIGEGFIEELDAILARDPDAGLVIIDTLQKIRPLTGKRGSANLYQVEYEDYEKVQKWSITNGVPVICIHHTRKGDPSKAGNPFDEMSGSTGIQGVADTLIVCDKVKGSNEGVMYVSGREVCEEDYIMTFDRQTMTWNIEVKEDTEIDTGPYILSTWFKSHDTITIKEGAKLWDVSQHTARRKLDALVEESKMVKNKDPRQQNIVTYAPTNPFQGKTGSI